MFSFLSNMYPCRVYYGGIEYPSSEHAYQAAKSTSETEQLEIRSAETPQVAKKLGRGVKNLRPDWDSVKIGIMERIVFDKFNRNVDLRNALLATKGFELIEGNWWKDTFWGICDGKGDNHMGKVLMKVRDKLEEKFGTEY